MMTGIELVQQVLRRHVAVPVVSKVPTTRPDSFIRVDQAAPTVLSPVHQRVRFIIQIYGVDQERVIDQAFAILRLVENLEAHHPDALGVEELTGPQEFSDPDLPKVFRWQITGLVYMTS